MSSSAEDLDLYGFPLSLTELQRSERAECDRAADVEQAIWMEYIEKERLPNSEAKIKEMIRKGIYPTCRTWVWMQTSGAAKKKAGLASKYYSMMVKEGESSNCLPNIEEDCKSTFLNHAWLSSEDGQAARKRVLSAYSIHNDKVGYCYAMNSVVGILLVAMNRNEENAFWLLAALVEDTLYPGTYSRDLQGCQIEMKALDELILHKLPKLHAHLQSTMCDISIIATDWYLCLFSTSVPSETVARIWDALFNEGPKILYRVALALLKLEEDKLLAFDNAGEIVMHMRKVVTVIHNRDKLMAMAFDGIGSLPMATIDKFREMRTAAGGEAAPSSGMAGLSLQSGAAGQKVKQGFGKFMTGLDKWANKTADSMAKAAEKVGIKDN